jgi:hypothetical protein
LIPMRERHSLTQAEAIERLSGYSIDRCEQILEQPLETVLAQPQAAILLNAQVQCIRAVFHTMTKLGLEHSRLAARREEVLEKLSAGLRDAREAGK